MMLTQGGGCAICQKPPKRGVKLVLDRECVTLRVRGLLCSKCDHAIRLLGQDDVRIRRAAAYVAKSGEIFSRMGGSQALANAPEAPPDELAPARATLRDGMRARAARRATPR